MEFVSSQQKNIMFAILDSFLMLFNSYLFIFLFLPIVLTIFYSLKNKNLSICWLIGASFFFYAWWNYIYLFLLIFSLLLNYYITVILTNIKKRYRKIILSAGIILNLSILGYFKYCNFFIKNINSIFDDINLHEQSIILPLAISFYTFQKIAYLIDTYKFDRMQWTL